MLTQHVLEGNWFLSSSWQTGFSGGLVLPGWDIFFIQYKFFPLAQAQAKSAADVHTFIVTFKDLFSLGDNQSPLRLVLAEEKKIAQPKFKDSVLVATPKDKHCFLICEWNSKHRDFYLTMITMAKISWVGCFCENNMLQSMVTHSCKFICNMHFLLLSSAWSLVWLNVKIRMSW